MGLSLVFPEVGITIMDIMWVFPGAAMGTSNIWFSYPAPQHSPLPENSFPFSLLPNFMTPRAAAILLHDLAPLATVD